MGLSLPDCYRCHKQPCECADRITLYHGDALKILPEVARVDVMIADPPHGTTSLEWDKAQYNFQASVNANQMWCFGPLRYWLAAAEQFSANGWKLAQEIIWEKHNGSSFHADRFNRVHEIIVHWYRGAWSGIYKHVPTTLDAIAKTTRRKKRPPHMGEIAAANYVSHDGGPRLMRSVIRVRSCHGYAMHPAQKPIGIVVPLIEMSCPKAGVILDPFVGSGTTLRAAKDLGRRAIGIEIEEKYCGIAAGRLEQEVLFT